MCYCSALPSIILAKHQHIRIVIVHMLACCCWYLAQSITVLSSLTKLLT